MSVFAQDADLAPIGQLMRAVIEGDAAADWHQAAHILGIHAETATKLGIGPGIDGIQTAESIGSALNDGTLMDIEKISEQLPDGNP